MNTGRNCNSITDLFAQLDFQKKVVHSKFCLDKHISVVFCKVQFVFLNAPCFKIDVFQPDEIPYFSNEEFFCFDFHLLLFSIRMMSEKPADWNQSTATNLQRNIDLRFTTKTQRQGEFFSLKII